MHFKDLFSRLEKGDIPTMKMKKESVYFTLINQLK